MPCVLPESPLTSVHQPVCILVRAYTFLGRYMECQNAVAHMVDGDLLEITASTQGPAICHAAAMAVRLFAGHCFVCTLHQSRAYLRRGRGSD
jgi:hypothetical protein